MNDLSGPLLAGARPSSSLVTPLHLDTADKMSREILNHPPELQNEMVTYIREVVIREQRINIESVEKQLAYLRQHYRDLVGDQSEIKAKQ